MTRPLPLSLALAAVFTACGGGTPMPTPQDTRQVSSFNATLDDPSRCTCDNGLRTYGIRTLAAGRLDIVATVQPAEARLVVRLMDNTINTVHAVSTQTGATARLGFDVVPANYVVQVFLASDGPRQATFTLEARYP